MDAAGQPDVQGWILFFLLDVNRPDVSVGLVGFSSGILRINRSAETVLLAWRKLPSEQAWVGFLFSLWFLQLSQW